ncbi:hypothetical protein J6590_061143 [Homalodisca vitripennis]|nr:hypothetical protein J6590_061143 [Homalodisca vitripennis]
MAAVGEGICIYNEGYLLTMTQLLDQVGLSPGASTASHAKKRDSDRLRELVDFLNYPEKNVDVQNMSVTLDMLCLTLSQPPKPVIVPTESQLPNLVSPNTSNDEQFPTVSLTIDNLQHLPDYQHKAISLCVEESKPSEDESVQVNRVMRSVSGALVATPFDTIPVLCNIAPPEIFRRELLLREFKKIISFPTYPSCSICLTLKLDYSPINQPYLQLIIGPFEPNLIWSGQMQCIQRGNEFVEWVLRQWSTLSMIAPCAVLWEVEPVFTAEGILIGLALTL